MLVELEVDGEAGDKVLEVAKRTSLMQIAASIPILDKSQVTQDVLDEESGSCCSDGQRSQDASKAAHVKEKIVEGKLNKFYSENCLLQQDFVKDGE